MFMIGINFDHILKVGGVMREDRKFKIASNIITMALVILIPSCSIAEWTLYGG